MKIENIFCYIFKPMGETFQKIYLNKKLKAVFKIEPN